MVVRWNKFLVTRVDIIPRIFNKTVVYCLSFVSVFRINKCRKPQAWTGMNDQTTLTIPGPHLGECEYTLYFISLRSGLRRLTTR